MTTQSKYPSRYSPNKLITGDQYILELICEKRAQYLKRDLPIKFWELPEWSSYFKSQLRKCHSLTKKYDTSSIIKALKDKRTYSVYSLHAKWLIPIIEEYNKIAIINKKNSANSKFVISTTENTIIRPPLSSPNIIDRLQNLE